MWAARSESEHRNRWRRTRAALAWSIGLLGIAAAALSVRSFFVTDKLDRWWLTSDAVIVPQEQLTEPRPGLIAFKAAGRWHHLGLSTGRGRLLFTHTVASISRPISFQSDPGVEFVPQRTVNRWHYESASPIVPEMYDPGWSGGDVAEVGIKWFRRPSITGTLTLPAASGIQVGLPLPLVAVLLLVPLAMLLVARARQRQLRGRFPVVLASGQTPAGESAAGR